MLMVVGVLRLTLYIHGAASLKDKGQRVPLETAIGKLFVSESLQRACLDAVQIHGGYGFMDEFAISRLYRDQKILEIVKEARFAILSAVVLGFGRAIADQPAVYHIGQVPGE